MNLINIALSSYGAEVIQESSSSDSSLSNNLLSDHQSQIWNSGQGLPQFVVISLEKVNINYSHLSEIGFHCWHDYTTNPQTVEVSVAPSTSEAFVFWTRITLKKQSGKQFFKISKLPSHYRIIKITIIDTFGSEDETYLNQIFLMADLENPSNISNADLDEEEPSVKVSYDHESIKPREARQSNKMKKQDWDRHRDTEEIDLRKYDQFQDNTFHNRQKYSTQKSQYERSKSFNTEEMEELEQKDESLSKNIALLALSKNVLEMQENIEQIRRTLQVLDLKINMSYEKLESNILDKVERLLDKKLKDFKNELMMDNNQSRDLREVRSERDRKEFIKSKEFKNSREELIEGNSKESSKNREREAKRSLHLKSLNNDANKKSRVEEKEELVADLMTKLAKKLKERELKLKKIESKRLREQQDRPRHHTIHHKY